MNFLETHPKIVCLHQNFHVSQEHPRKWALLEHSKHCQQHLFHCNIQRLCHESHSE